MLWQHSLLKLGTVTDGYAYVNKIYMGKSHFFSLWKRKGYNYSATTLHIAEKPSLTCESLELSEQLSGTLRHQWHIYNKSITICPSTVYFLFQPKRFNSCWNYQFLILNIYFCSKCLHFNCTYSFNSS